MGFFCQNKKALPLTIYLDFKDTKTKAQSFKVNTKSNYLLTHKYLRSTN